MVFQLLHDLLEILMTNFPSKDKKMTKEFHTQKIRSIKVNAYAAKEMFP